MPKAFVEYLPKAGSPECGESGGDMNSSVSHVTCHDPGPRHGTRSCAHFPESLFSFLPDFDSALQSVKLKRS